MTALTYFITSLSLSFATMPGLCGFLSVTTPSTCSVIKAIATMAGLRVQSGLSRFKLCGLHDRMHVPMSNHATWCMHGCYHCMAGSTMINIVFCERLSVVLRGLFHAFSWYGVPAVLVERSTAGLVRHRVTLPRIVFCSCLLLAVFVLMPGSYWP